MANYVSDYDFNNTKFILGQPLKPFMQLLNVLPSQSSFLLPEKLRKIMLNNNSSVIHLYPKEFKQDFLYKNKYWQGIPLLPALEINNIIKIYNKYEKKLSKIELERNKIIQEYIFKN